MFGVSIVICCFNSANRLQITLDHVCSQVAGQIPWEVILVDNASKDGTAEIARSLWPHEAPVPLRIVHEDRPGLSHARRCGFRESHYEFVSFIDDDNWISPDWIVNVFKLMMHHPEVGACGGISTPVFEIEPPAFFHRYAGYLAIGEQASMASDVTDTRGWLWGAGLTVRKTGWEQIQKLGWKSLMVGRKGKHLTSGEDNEMCYWLRFLGWRLFYSPTLHLQHYIPRQRITFEYLLRMIESNGRVAIVDSAYRRVLARQSSLFERPLFRRWLSDLRYTISSLRKASFDIQIEQSKGEQNWDLDFQRARLLAQLKALVVIGPLGYRNIYRQILPYLACAQSDEINNRKTEI